MRIPDDCVKIYYDGKGLAAKLPDGTKIPCIMEININSKVGSLVTATIKLVVDASEVDQWDEVLQKEVVVQHTIKGEDLIKVINASRKEERKIS